VNTKTLLITALRSLRHHKGRSLLTMLGIIIGIGSIVAIMAIGRGAEERIKREIMASGDNSIFIHPGNWIAQESGKDIKKKIPPFSYQDVEILKRYVHSIKKISPAAFGRDTLVARGKNMNTSIKSGNADLLNLMSRTVARGQFYNHEHVLKGSRVIVIGHKIADELFKREDPIGKTVQIKKINFTIIGVVKKMEQQLGFEDANMDVFIPITTAKKISLAPPGDKISGICISTKSMDDIPNAVRQIKKIMRARRRIGIKETDDFTVWDQASMLKAANVSSLILNILLLIIASISLFVGGIGVMNIMLVSVKERTQEIGIRMALGAPDKTILRQFLFESVILCSIGGFIGMIIGCCIPFIVAKLTGWMVIITPMSMLVACIAIMGVGILFGYYPARKASRLDPVQALVEQ
jgi:putative ABC transport system permease protein